LDINRLGGGGIGGRLALTFRSPDLEVCRLLLVVIALAGVIILRRAGVVFLRQGVVGIGLSSLNLFLSFSLGFSAALGDTAG